MNDRTPPAGSRAARFRLVALDVDGTLKPREAPITPRVQAAVAATLASGVAVTIATGRMFRSALPFARALDLASPIICYGGAVVKDPTTGETLYRQRIREDLARLVVAAARARGLSVVGYTDDALYVERLSPASPFAGYVVRSSARVVDDVLDHLAEEPCHMAIVADGIGARRLVHDLREEFGAALSVTSGHPLLAEIDHPEVSKGTALDWIARSMGIDRTAVLAVGDDWNDIAMLEYAGLGVAMGDAQPEVLEVADVVAPTAVEDGVAWALETYVLAEGCSTGTGCANR